MNTFKMQCINYLLVRGWEQDVDGWEWSKFYPYGDSPAYHQRAVTIGQALDFQFEDEDEGPH